MDKDITVVFFKKEEEGDVLAGYYSEDTLKIIEFDDISISHNASDLHDLVAVIEVKKSQLDELLGLE